MAWMDYELTTVGVPSAGPVRALTVDVKVYDAITGAPPALMQNGEAVTTIRTDGTGRANFQAQDSLVVRVEALGWSMLVESDQQKIAKGTFAGDLDAAVDGGLARAEADGRLMSPTAAADAFAPRLVGGNPAVRTVNGRSPGINGQVRLPSRATYTVTTGTHASAFYHLARIRVADSNPHDVIRKVTGGDHDKTWTSGPYAPPRETPAQFYARSGAPLIVNGSGWETSGGAVYGVQFAGGRYLTTGPVGANGLQGRDAIGVRTDGTLGIYSVGEEQQAIDDGVTDTWASGPALVVDGAGRDLTADIATWPGLGTPTSRTVFGQATNGDYLLLIVEGGGSKSAYSAGLGGQAMVDLAVAVGFRQALLLDGGGSTQLTNAGLSRVASSDATARSVPDVIAVFADLADAVALDSGWITLPDRNAGWSGGTVRCRRVDKTVKVEVIGVSRSGGATGLSPILTLPPHFWPPAPGAFGLAYLNVTPNASQNARVSSAGTVDVAATANGDVYASWVYFLD